MSTADHAETDPTACEAMPALARRLARAQRVVVLTGAGISASAGIPTYRGLGAPPPEQVRALTANTWHLDHEANVEVWETMARGMGSVEPTAAHRALVSLEAFLVARHGSLTVITQNVDGLHQRAGSSNVLEMHGGLHENTPWIEEETPSGPLRRPDVVFFGEGVAHRQTIAELLDDVDLMLVVGTSGTVHPAAGLPSTATTWSHRDDPERSIRRRATTALINAEPWGIGDSYPHSFAHELIGPADKLLPALVDAVLEIGLAGADHVGADRIEP